MVVVFCFVFGAVSARRMYSCIYVYIFVFMYVCFYQGILLYVLTPFLIKSVMNALPSRKPTLTGLLRKTVAVIEQVPSRGFELNQGNDMKGLRDSLCFIAQLLRLYMCLYV